MDATKVAQFHFRAKTGSSATRADSRGNSEFGDPLGDLPSFKAQYDEFKHRRNRIRREVEQEGLPFARREALRRELADCLREIGSMREILSGGARLAFEKIFTAVASKRLPKERFLAMVDEAREIWRADGWDTYVPSASKGDKRRAYKAGAHRAQQRTWAAR